MLIIMQFFQAAIPLSNCCEVFSR